MKFRTENNQTQKNIKMRKLLFLLTITLFNLGFAFPQQDVFQKPAQQQLVVDNAGVFSSQEISMLKEKLHRFSNETSTQVLVYTTPDLQGYDVADFAQRLGQNWGIGQKGFDNGIVIVFKPKNEEPGRITIQTGYGIEPLIPDATANQIIDIEMIPEFQKGNIYQGFDKALDVCIALTKKEFTAQNYKEKAKKGSEASGFIVMAIIMIVFFSVFAKSKSSRHYNTGGRSSLPFWAAMFLLGSGSHRGSGWGDFSSGSGSFGGGGSSFGGFGGGSFGGGGASGSW